MKAIVMSDSHGCFSAISRVVEQEPGASLLIHAGDVHRDVEDILTAWPELPCAYVLGNNDFFVHQVPDERLFTFGGQRIFLTHGHRYGVKYSLEKLLAEARAREANICIFGHTHQGLLENRGGIWLLNPGAVLRSYAVIEIKDGKPNITIKRTDV